jgi:hypothetical protein
MGILGAEVRTPLGEPWRVGKRPYGPAALSITASCLKGFYLHQAALGVNTELGKSLSRSRLPSRLDRRRSFLGHTTTSLPANPLAPQGPRRRHPKMLDGAARTTSCRPVDLSRSTCGAPAVFALRPFTPRVLRVHAIGSSTGPSRALRPAAPAAEHWHVCRSLRTGSRVMSIRHRDGSRER